jgi:hypothetical protein
MFSMKLFGRRVAFWLLFVLAGLGTLGRAQESTGRREAIPASSPPGSIRTLFVGNSLFFGAGSPVRYYRSGSVTDLNGTGFGGVPALFKAFTRQAGLDYAVSHVLNSGKGLDFHLAAHPTILGMPWDAAILLSHSLLDRDRPGDPALLAKSVVSVCQLIESGNPKVSIKLVTTLPRPDQVYVANGHWYGRGMERMAADVRQGYELAASAASLVGAVIPAGEAWILAVQAGIADANPYDGIGAGQMNLWAEDNHHASAQGYYLTALVIFGTVTGLDPRSLGPEEQCAFDLGISKRQARALQAVAFDLWAKQSESAPLQPFARQTIPHP